MNYTRESANPKSSRDEDAPASLLRREADADLRMRIRNDRRESAGATTRRFTARGERERGAVVKIDYDIIIRGQHVRED